MVLWKEFPNKKNKSRLGTIFQLNQEIIGLTDWQALDQWFKAYTYGN